MAARKASRYLAPLALLAIAAAIALLVRGHLSPSSSHPSSPNAIGPSLIHSTRKASPPRHHGRAVYVVKVGDTLTGISVRTGVPVATLEALNPRLDPNALQTGQRLRLRR